MSSEKPEKDDYLWDKSGEPDPEIVRLERVLQPLRHQRSAPVVTPLVRSRSRMWVPLAAAAAVLFVALILYRSRGEERAWDVTPVAGLPSCDGEPMEKPARLAEGEWLVTDESSRAELAVAEIGSVQVEPNSRVRLIKTGEREHRLELRQGTIAARINAPPRLFIVETPSALAVDLGCAYTLTVDAQGAGKLHVTAGWVAFEKQGIESIVPKNASCQTHATKGPGTPYFDDASEAFRFALARYDFGGADLEIVLKEARARDSLSLFHIFQRLDVDARRRVLSRMLELGTELPSGVSEEAVIALEPSAIAAFKHDLRFDWEFGPFE